MENKPKFIIKAPIIGEDHFWLKLGLGNTPDRARAFRFDAKVAKELKDKEPMLELIPV